LGNKFTELNKKWNVEINGSFGSQIMEYCIRELKFRRSER